MWRAAHIGQRQIRKPKKTLNIITASKAKAAQLFLLYSPYRGCDFGCEDIMLITMKRRRFQKWNRSKQESLLPKKRKELNLTQEQLAERLGVSNKTISKWETGKCMPDYAIVKSLRE